MGAGGRRFESYRPDHTKQGVTIAMVVTPVSLADDLETQELLGRPSGKRFQTVSIVSSALYRVAPEQTCEGPGLRTVRQIRVAALAKQLQVTEETIRRDL
ncbi:TPA: hypothetical protein DCE37_12695 [Candidatus Latescibacteria bacterium]|nr:hypothetical protein [Candidatus Latescibacterota bacterium]